MNRRHFLQRASILSAGFSLADPEIANGQEITSLKWRRFQVTTHIEILKPAGVTRVWAPVALAHDTPFQRKVTNTLRCDAGTANIIKKARGLELIAAEFAPGAKPALTLTTEIETRDWSVDYSRPATHECQNVLN